MSLYEDALKLSVNKSLEDIKTLLDWAGRAGDIDEKLRHITQALELLQEVQMNMSELKNTS